MDETFKMDATRKDIFEVARDIMRDQHSKAEIVDMIVEAAFQEWGAAGSRKACKDFVTEVVIEAVMKFDPPLQKPEKYQQFSQI